jgi:hypothetical protein
MQLIFKGKEAKKISDAGGGGKPSKQLQHQQQQQQPVQQHQQKPSQEEPPYVSIDKTPELKPKTKEISTASFLSTLNDVSAPPVDRSVKPLSTKEIEKSKNKDQVNFCLEKPHPYTLCQERAHSQPEAIV